MASLPTKNISTTALVVEKPGAPFLLENVILDEVRSQELLVEIKYAGVCHTVSLHACSIVATMIDFFTGHRRPRRQDADWFISRRAWT